MFKQQRLFFALIPDDGVRQRLVELTAQLDQHHARAHHPYDLHLTLAFLGMVHSYRIDHIEEAADKVRGREFTLQLDHVGFWKRSRTLWCAPPETPRALVYLEEDLWEELADQGFEREHPTYQPHVTLLRKASSLRDQPQFEPIEWRVSEFALVWSQDGVDPPRYKILNRWDLDAKK